MRNVLFILIIACLSFSCTQKITNETDPVTKQEVIVPNVVGGDVDVNGCKASAGYTWSILKNNCIRIFEAGTKLSHFDDEKAYTTAAYVIFEGDKAELFLDTQKEAIILERKSEGEPWINEDWHLIPWKGYVLKKGDKIIYTGN